MDDYRGIFVWFFSVRRFGAVMCIYLELRLTTGAVYVYDKNVGNRNSKFQSASRITTEQIRLTSTMQIWHFGFVQYQFSLEHLD